MVIVESKSLLVDRSVIVRHTFNCKQLGAKDETISANDWSVIPLPKKWTEKQADAKVDSG